jgi:hypothetical protein
VVLVTQRQQLHVNRDITVDVFGVTGAERFTQEPTALAPTLFIEQAVITLNVLAELRFSPGAAEMVTSLAGNLVSLRPLCS